MTSARSRKYFAPLELIAWPYEDMRPALQALPAGALIRPAAGPLYRGDLEQKAYPLYVTYTAEANCPAALCPSRPLADFGGAFQLLSAVTRTQPNGLRLELVWRAARDTPSSSVAERSHDAA